MKQITFFFSFITFVMLYSCQPKQKPITTDPEILLAEIDKNAFVNTLTASETENGWQLLFNGADFTGWHGYNMTGIPDCWVIADNSLTMTTVGGAESQDIITDKVYRNFAFSAEFKVDSAANSGIIFQIKEDTIYKFPYETGPEFQVIDQENWPDSLADWQISGANYAMHTPKVRPYKPVGEWNTALIVVDGNKVTYYLNGEMTVQYEKYSDDWNSLRGSGKWANFPDYGKYDEGNISLQNHGSRVWYRNVKIKELPVTTTEK